MVIEKKILAYDHNKCITTRDSKYIESKYIEFFSAAKEIYSWKSKGMSEQSIKNPPGLELD